MKQTADARSWVTAVLFLSVWLVGCDLRTHSRADEAGAGVDIRTPWGGLSARGEADVRKTGLPIYPGARPLSDSDEHSRGSVAISTALFQLEVSALKFETADSSSAVLGFYRDALRAFGDVVECRGNIDFKGRRRHKRPVCHESRRHDETQLLAGGEDDFRTVAVKTHGQGTEFSLVAVSTRKPD